jgi:hypothetical protein
MAHNVLTQCIEAVQRMIHRILWRSLATQRQKHRADDTLIDIDVSEEKSSQNVDLESSLNEMTEGYERVGRTRQCNWW